MDVLEIYLLPTLALGSSSQNQASHSPLCSLCHPFLEDNATHTTCHIRILSKQNPCEPSLPGLAIIVETMLESVGHSQYDLIISACFIAQDFRSPF